MSLIAGNSPSSVYEFIASTESLLEVNGLSQYIVDGTGPFESGLEEYLGVAEQILGL